MEGHTTQGRVAQAGMSGKRGGPIPMDPAESSFLARRVETFLDDLPIPAIVIDGAGCITAMNRHAGETLGGARASVGTPIHEVLLPHKDLLDLAARDWKTYRRVQRQGAEGRTQVLAVRAKEAVQRGEDAGQSLIVTFEDRTQFERLRAEHDRLLQIATVGAVLPSILHELKNPLAAVITALEVELEDLVDSKLGQSLHGILSELRRMKIGFEGIAVVGRNLRSLRPMSVDHAVSEAVQVFRNRAAAAHMELTSHVDFMPLIHLDAAVLRAILFNLLSNALNACSSGDRITVRCTLLDEPQTLELAVEDTGCGMDEEVIAHCKDLFYTTRQNGSGIGLALCTRTVEDAGGTLVVESQRGVGTAIRIRVPLTQDTQDSTRMIHDDSHGSL